jgi:hypothetical protein
MKNGHDPGEIFSGSPLAFRLLKAAQCGKSGDFPVTEP